jgi:DNA-binding NarL/FixJ family response regulator
VTEQARAVRTLVVVDDQPEFVQLTRLRLSRAPGLAVVGDAESGEALLALLGKLDPLPEAVLLDVEMPGMDGFETARRLRELAPGLRIILTSASDARGYTGLAERLGAAFLPKRSLSPEAILRLLAS